MWVKLQVHRGPLQSPSCLFPRSLYSQRKSLKLKPLYLTSQGQDGQLLEMLGEMVLCLVGLRVLRSLGR